LPDFFIRLCKKGGIFSGDEYIAYTRLHFDAILQKKDTVKPTWVPLRKINTTLLGDSEDNYVGLLLFSINIFPNEKSYCRPLLIDNRNFKKYKLMSLIYMAKDLPNISKGEVISPFIKVQFNGREEETQADQNTLNPVWGQGLLIETLINEDLSLSDKIKLSCYNKSTFFNGIIGECEISLLEIKKYNKVEYIENDLYKYAKWYSLYKGVDEIPGKILAAFFIVRLVKQGKESIDINKFKFWPDEVWYKLYLHIVGVRQVPKDIDLINGIASVKFNKKLLESDGNNKEKFKHHKNCDKADNNVNNWDV